jgi:hypothetical protein
MKDQLINWFREHGGRLGLLLGMFLVGVLSFEAGYFYRGSQAEGSLMVTLPSLPTSVVPAQAVAGESVTVPASQNILGTPKPVVAVGAEMGQCVFVGSKNSTKYHLATCAAAKRIKPENRLCFATKEEAEKRGYVASCMK